MPERIPPATPRISATTAAELARLASACTEFNRTEFRKGVDFQYVGKREHLAITSFFLTHEHNAAISLLNRSGLEGASLAMLRPCFEALVRGIWILRASSDEQVENFCMGRDSKKVETLLKDIRTHSPEDAFLEQTWLKSEDSLHPFTHVSYQLLARRSADEAIAPFIDPTETARALAFAAGTSMLATVELAQLAGQIDLRRRALSMLAALYPATDVLFPVTA